MNKTHIIQVTVRFDKPISKQNAVHEFRDAIHGEFYPSLTGEVDSMKIGGIKATTNTRRVW